MSAVIVQIAVMPVFLISTCLQILILQNHLLSMLKNGKTGTVVSDVSQIEKAFNDRYHMVQFDVGNDDPFGELIDQNKYCDE